MTRPLSPDLEDALESAAKDDARQAWDIVNPLAVLRNVLAAYRALPAAPTGPWTANQSVEDGFEFRKDGYLRFFLLTDQRTAECYRDALNAAEQAMETK